MRKEEEKRKNWEVFLIYVFRKGCIFFFYLELRLWWVILFIGGICVCVFLYIFLRFF